MWARVLNLDTWVSGLEATDLRAVISDLLSEPNGEDGHPLEWVNADQNWRANLREDLALLLEAFLDVVEDLILTKVVKGE